MSEKACSYALKRHGQTVKTFPTKEQAAAEAFERGWVVTWRGLKGLVNGVKIEEAPHE